MNGHANDGEDAHDDHEEEGADGFGDSVVEALAEREVAGEEGFAGDGEEEPGEEEGGPVGYLPGEVGWIVFENIFFVVVVVSVVVVVVSIIGGSIIGIIR